MFRRDWERREAQVALDMAVGQEAIAISCRREQGFRAARARVNESIETLRNLGMPDQEIGEYMMPTSKVL